MFEARIKEEIEMVHEDAKTPILRGDFRRGMY